MAKTEKKGFGLHLTIAIIAGAFALIGLVLFLLGFSTNYYTFGGMNSVLIMVLIVLAMAAIAASAALIHKFPDKIWAKLMPLAAVGLLAAASMLIVGDRVEGIGNCIITDYDSGHGGEQAIYMSLVGAVSLIVSIIYIIIGLFHENITQPAPRGKTLGFSIAGGVLAVSAIIATLGLVGVNLTGGTSIGPGGVSSGEMASGTYTVSFNGNSGNVDLVQDTQFIPANVKGLLNADSRLFLDFTLTLDGAGNYTLFADNYVVEGGKRAEIGDDTGLGLILTTTAEGTYVDNGDGTVTTAPATHVVAVMETDTYSSQMKSPAKMKVGDNDADGTYDSNDYPEVLELVPETVWTIADGKILSYGKSALKGEFKVSFNGNSGNVDLVQDTQFIPANVKGLLNADTRLFLDFTLTLDGAGNYTLFADNYVVEGGKRAEIGDDTGLGLILTTTAEGTYVDNGDGTVTTAPATHAVAVMETDTYSSQMKSPAKMKVGDNDADGTYDSNDYPEVLELVPETVWTLSGSEIIGYSVPSDEEPADEQPAEDTPAAPAAEGVTIASDDGGTAINFNPDGTFSFDFDAYSVHEEGTYTYEGGVLTVTNPNGDSFTAEGDPMALHYVTAVSEQLAGDYTIPAAAFDFAPASEGGFDAFTVVSDDGGTKLTVNPDGTYVFAFESYGIEDPGTWSTVDGKTVFVNANGLEMPLEGGKLHYVSGVSEQLTGDFTFEMPASGGAASGFDAFTVVSDDGGTKLTVNPDGTYVFAFESYNIEDPGTWSTVDGKTVFVNANGLEMPLEGGKLHYVSGVSEQLTGDFTFEMPATGGAAAEPYTVPSDDGATTITFNGDGTYMFEFASYGVQDAGTYAFDGATLTVINSTGLEMTTSDGKLHYISGVSEQLTGDFTLDLSKL